MRYFVFDSEGMCTALAFRLSYFEGNEVMFFSQGTSGREHLLDMVPLATSMEQGLKWMGREGRFICGDEQDCTPLRKQGHKGYGGNAFTNKLENNRMFEMEIAKKCGIDIPNFHHVESAKEAIKFIQKKPDQYVLKQTGHAPKCYDEDTEVLTRQGWKFWRDVTLQDEFATLIDGWLQYERASELVCAPFDGQMIGWKNNTIDILVTPNHNMYVQHLGNKHEWRPPVFEEAKNCNNVRYKVLRSAKWFALDRITPEWAAFLGIYIAEGSCSRWAVHIAAVDKRKRAMVRQVLVRAGLKFSEYPTTFVIHDVRLKRELQRYGLAHEKYVPMEVRESGREVVEAFLYGYGLGDGSINAKFGFRTFHTCSKRLADEVQELLLKIGRVATISFYDPDTTKIKLINGRRVKSQRRMYQVYERIKRDGAVLKKNQRFTQEYHGNVYCATVSSHLLYVRRNGKPLWCGNTWNYVGKEEDGRDIIDQLEWIARQPEFRKMNNIPFMLQEFCEGLEFGCSAWWCYDDWLRTSDGSPIIELNREHKKQGNGDTGLTTGEMGTVMMLATKSRLFDEVLDKLTPILKQYASDVCLNIDVNCGITEENGKQTTYLYEITPREGYPACALSQYLLTTEIGSFFSQIIDKRDGIIHWKPGWGVVTVLGAGQFPHEGSQHEGSFRDQPVKFPFDVTDWDDHVSPLYIKYDRDKDYCRIADFYEYIAAVSFHDEDISIANQKCVNMMKEIDVRAPQYRSDIGQKFKAEELEKLIEGGYIPGKEKK